MVISLFFKRGSLFKVPSRVGVPRLVAAVSNAGGLGTILPHSLVMHTLTNDLVLSGVLTALTQPSPDALREAIHETRKLTQKPFGVNITLLPSINPPDYEGYAKAAVEEGIKIFETAGNNREQDILLCMRSLIYWWDSWSNYHLFEKERLYGDS